MTRGASVSNQQRRSEVEIAASSGSSIDGKLQRVGSVYVLVIFLALTLHYGMSLSTSRMVAQHMRSTFSFAVSEACQTP